MWKTKPHAATVITDSICSFVTCLDVFVVTVIGHETNIP